MVYFGKYPYEKTIFRRKRFCEAISIPDNNQNTIETLVRRELSKPEFSRFRYKDHVIRFCRHDVDEIPRTDL